MSGYFLWYHAIENMLGEFDDDTILEANHCGTIYFNTTMNGVEVWLHPDRMIPDHAYVVFQAWVKDGSNRKTEFNLRDYDWDDLRKWASEGTELPELLLPEQLKV
jgi:hypothetical protein